MESWFKSLIRFYPDHSISSFGDLVELEDGKGFRLHLNASGTSWVDGWMMDQIPDMDTFETLWDLKPEKRGQVKIMGKVMDVPRFQQSYGKEYWFSGLQHEALPTPDIIRPYLDWANASEYTKMYGLGAFNQTLLNWYPDATQYIGMHSDDESDMRVGENGESIVVSMTFQEGCTLRTFRMKPKSKLGKTKEERRILGKERVDIDMSNGLVLVMGGLCQKTHTHQVPKAPKSRSDVGRRINLTFRQFK